MKNEPIWRIKSEPTEFPCLDVNYDVDVAIIGGGITGITLACLLKRTGLKTAVLEARKVAKGTTGQSTGNLYELTEYSLKELQSKYDIPTLRKIILSRREAMNLIEKNIRDLEIDCDFKRVNMYLFEQNHSISIKEEQEIAKELPIEFQRIHDPEFPFSFDSGIVYPDQAQINPLKYVEALANETHDDTCLIFENTRVVEIEEKDDFILLHTEKARMQAKKVVHATHTPIDLQIQYHTALGPYREYGIAAKLKGNSYPEGIFWGSFNDKKFSVRTYSPDDDPHLICVGSMHKVGQAKDNQAHIEELKEFIHKHFDVRKITHQWGGQNYKPADLLPYIGRLKSGSEQFVATGYSTDGLVYGTLAATILCDEILDRKNAYAELYKASRHSPIKAAKKVVSENLNVVKRLIGDNLRRGIEMQAKDLYPTQGKLLELEDGKFAVYKTHEGEVKILSPICPHMKCTVQWNNAEKTWDCPCHGSRFDTDGKVIEGPSLHHLENPEEDS